MIRLVLVVVLGVFTFLSVAGAQGGETPSDLSEENEARDHHHAALDALESGNLEAAERGFRAALALTPRASTAFNLALVLIDRLQYVEAIVLLRGLERGRYGESPVPSEELESHRQIAEEGVATLRLNTDHSEPISLLINERESGSVSLGHELRLRLDPGTYEIRGATLPLEPLSVQLDAGEEAHRDLFVSEEAPKSSRGLVIGLVIAAVVVVAAATVLTVSLLSNDDDGGGLPVVYALGAR